MPRITIPTDVLGSRVPIIQSLLRPLRDGSDVACDLDPGMAHRGKALAAHDGMGISIDYRGWRFRTCARDIHCQYFEIWSPFEGGRSLFLWRAYLNLFQLRRDTHSEAELLCVHCDPEDDSGEPTCRYKRGPHLHVVRAEEPLQHCHFPLNLGQLDEVLSSVASLTDAMRMAIGVVRHEVLNRFVVRRTTGS